MFPFEYIEDWLEGCASVQMYKIKLLLFVSDPRKCYLNIRSNINLYREQYSEHNKSWLTFFILGLFRKPIIQYYNTNKEYLKSNL
jgi:hypothetical protein